jgi:cell division protein FtsB
LKKLIAFLLVMTGLLQYRLWFGDGGITELNDLQDRAAELRQETGKRQERNAALEADVKDLKEGTDAIEERARQELGMVKEGEVFIQVIEMPKHGAEENKPRPDRPDTPKHDGRGPAPSR